MASAGPACRAFDDNLLTVGDNLTVGENPPSIVATDRQ
jgi:hypothetical protein